MKFPRCRSLDMLNFIFGQPLFAKILAKNKSLTASNIKNDYKR
jgi:hypothetical protein